MTDEYLGWTLLELRAERRKVQDLLSHGSITRTSENGSETQFSRVDLQKALRKIYYSISLRDGATADEVTQGSPTNKVMRITSAYPGTICSTTTCDS